jgi:hypothetical protein
MELAYSTLFIKAEAAIVDVPPGGTSVMLSPPEMNVVDPVVMDDIAMVR